MVPVLAPDPADVGDALRAAVGTVLDLPYEQVPPFLDWDPWWDALRWWARMSGVDAVCVTPVDGSVRPLLADLPAGCTGLFIALGPARGGRTAVVVDEDLLLLHDPHPDRAGLDQADEVIAFCEPYEPEPGAIRLG